MSDSSLALCPMTSQLDAWAVISSIFCTLGHHFRKMEGFEWDWLAQNLLLMNYPENGESFLSKRIPHKILETIFCRKIVKKLFFSGNFGPDLLSQICKWLKTSTIFKGNLFTVIPSLFKTAPVSSLFQKRCPNPTHFPKNDLFQNYGPYARYLWP